MAIITLITRRNKVWEEACIASCPGSGDIRDIWWCGTHIMCVIKETDVYPYIYVASEHAHIRQPHGLPRLQPWSSNLKTSRFTNALYSPSTNQEYFYAEIQQMWCGGILATVGEKTDAINRIIVWFPWTRIPTCSNGGLVSSGLRNWFNGQCTSETQIHGISCIQRTQGINYLPGWLRGPVCI
jgi:hypothetical protein